MPVFTANVPSLLQVGDRIEIGGKIKEIARKMSVNLCAQEGEEPRDVVLHFDVRFHRDNIISLSRKNGVWIGSGNYDTNYNMFVPGTVFRIIFEIKDTDVITIYCQGKFHSNFLPKIPLTMAKYIVAWADVERVTHCYFHLGSKIDEYKSKAEECMVNAWRVIHLSGWTVEKKGSQKGDIVESRQTEFGKVYRFTGTVECPAKFLYEEFKVNLAKLPEWNPTILKSEFIKDIDTGVDLSYQVTAGGGRGIIAPRDFVILRRSAQLSETGEVVEENPYSYILSGISVTVPGYPPVKDLVRGHNKVGCWFIKPKTVTTSGGKIEELTTFQWLMCCDLKGKIPQFVLDAAFATVMLDYIKHVRKFIADNKAEGKF